MKSNKNKINELTELFEELNLDTEASSEIRHELEAGDAFLNQQSEPVCPDELIGRITRDIEKQSGDRSWAIQIRRIAAVFVLGFVLVGLLELSQKPFEMNSLGQHAVLLADDFDVLEIALDLEQEEFQVDFDYPEIADILSLWDDADWDLQQLLGKELSDENDTLSFYPAFNDRIA